MSQSIFSRRRFLKIAGGTIFTLAGGCALVSLPLFPEALKPSGQKTEDAATDVRYLRQIITADSRSSRTIMWQSMTAQDNAEVIWRPCGSQNLTVISAPGESFTDDAVRVYLHTAAINGLDPGQRYEYCVRCGPAETKWQPLPLDDGSAFKMLIFPDSQSNDYSDWKNLAQKSARQNSDAALFTNLGDLVDNGEDHTQWNAWFDALHGIISRMPLAPVMGNHETYNRQWKVRLPQAYRQEFVLPDNGSPVFSRYYYSFDYGEVHFCVLNTQWDETEAFQPGLLAAQQQWVAKDMSQSQKKWKIILMHKDVLTYGMRSHPERLPGISDAGRAFMPLFDTLGIDLVLSAHLHTYRNRGHIHNFQRSRHGPVYILAGVAGNVRYPGLWLRHELDQIVAPQPETDNYLTLTAAADELRLRCFLPDGTPIDDVRLEK